MDDELETLLRRHYRRAADDIHATQDLVERSQAAGRTAGTPGRGSWLRRWTLPAVAAAVTVAVVVAVTMALWPAPERTRPVAPPPSPVTSERPTPAGEPPALTNTPVPAPSGSRPPEVSPARPGEPRSARPSGKPSRKPGGRAAPTPDASPPLPVVPPPSAKPSEPR